jgi:hypothetical protein
MLDDPFEPAAFLTHCMGFVERLVSIKVYCPSVERSHREIPVVWTLGRAPDKSYIPVTLPVLKIWRKGISACRGYTGV